MLGRPIADENNLFLSFFSDDKNTNFFSSNYIFFSFERYRDISLTFRTTWNKSKFSSFQSWIKKFWNGIKEMRTGQDQASHESKLFPVFPGKKSTWKSTRVLKCLFFCVTIKRNQTKNRFREEHLKLIFIWIERLFAPICFKLVFTDSTLFWD